MKKDVKEREKKRGKDRKGPVFSRNMVLKFEFYFFFGGKKMAREKLQCFGTSVLFFFLFWMD